MVYRDATQVFAWPALAVVEARIMTPEALPAATFKGGLEATFRDRVTRRMAESPTDRQPGDSPGIGAELPADADERLRALRSPVTRELRPALLTRA